MTVDRRHLPVFADPALIADAAQLEPGEILALLANRPAWMNRAECRQPESQHVTFFPERGRSAGPALQVCGRCPVLADCRSWVLSLDEPQPVGVIAGMTATARGAARRARRPQPTDTANRLATERALRQAGHTLRAIAATVGVSQATVLRDLRDTPT